MKKTLSALLCASIFLLLTPVSCSWNTTSNVNTENVTKAALTENTEAAVTADPSYTDDVPDLDYNGYTFRILGLGGDPATSNPAYDIIYDEEKSGDLVEDAKHTCFSELEERFNIKVDNYLAANAYNTVKKDLLAGSTGFDVIALTSSDSFSLLADQLLMCVNKLSYIDLTKNYWDTNLNEGLSIGDNSYFLGGDMFTRTADWSFVLMYNRDLIAKYTLADPYNLVNDNTWTLDAFNDIIRSVSQDLNGDGQFTSEDLYGLSTGYAPISGFYFSSGLTILERDSNNMPVITGFSEKMEKTLSKARKIAYEDNSTLIDSWDVIYNSFRDGRSVFYAEILAKMTGMRDVDADISIVPYPKYDENQEKYLTTTDPSIIVLSIPLTADTERTGAILEAYAAAAHNTVRSAFVDLTLTRKSIRDDKGVEMLDIIMDSFVYDLGYFNSPGGIGTLFSTLIQNPKNEYASSFASTQEKAAKELVNLIDAFSGK